MDLSFTGSSIALIVRGKIGPDHHPPIDDQHADCILKWGSPIGFFGEGITIGGIPGKVYTYSIFCSKRPWYVSLDSAKSRSIVSTVLQFSVTGTEATEFQNCWHGMAAHPDMFGYIGNNCSTHAARAFARAGIIDAEIPGLDTPDNLFGALQAARPDARSNSGYLYFSSISSSTNELDQAFRVTIDATSAGVGGGSGTSITPSGGSSLSSVLGVESSAKIPLEI
jgi:hypothetical protein